MDYLYSKVDRDRAIFSAKRLMVDTIWKNANIEIATGITFPETVEVLEGRVPGTLKFDDALVVNNLKRSWEFLFEHIDAPISFQVISQYNHILGEGGLIENAGHLRSYGVGITGTTYRPPLPEPDAVFAKISELDSISHPVERGLSYFSEISKAQWFNDGNKRTASMVANHYLIQQCAGLFAMDVPSKRQFFTALINYYETDDRRKFLDFLYQSAFEVLPSGLTIERLDDSEKAQLLDGKTELIFNGHPPRNKFEERLAQAQQDNRSDGLDDQPQHNKTR